MEAGNIAEEIALAETAAHALVELLANAHATFPCYMDPEGLLREARDTAARLTVLLDRAAEHAEACNPDA